MTPCILFFDELDSLTSKRSLSGEDGNSKFDTRVLGTFLTELDGINSNRGAGGREGGAWSQFVPQSESVSQYYSELNLPFGFRTGSIIVIAATNRHDALDPALIRPGRIDQVGCVGGVVVCMCLDWVGAAPSRMYT
jgi:SpoVK/Ycf46/Vps4 family AAA+-type ATPase